MGDIIFDCPHCGKSLEVDDEGAGMSVPCPVCGADVRIPAGAESAQESGESPTDYSTQEPVAERKPKVRTAKAASAARRILVHGLTAVVVVLIILTVAGVVWWNNQPRNTSGPILAVEELPEQKGNSAPLPASGSTNSAALQSMAQQAHARLLLASDRASNVASRAEIPLPATAPIPPGDLVSDVKPPVAQPAEPVPSANLNLPAQTEKTPPAVMQSDGESYVVTVASDPPSARVEVNNLYVGLTPCEVKGQGAGSNATIRVTPSEADGPSRSGFPAGEGGLTVERVLQTSLADRMGIRRGDRILAISGQAVQTADEVDAALRQVGFGEEIGVRVQRGASQFDLKGRVNEKPRGVFYAQEKQVKGGSYLNGQVIFFDLRAPGLHPITLGGEATVTSQPPAMPSALSPSPPTPPMQSVQQPPAPLPPVAAEPLTVGRFITTDSLRSGMKFDQQRINRIRDRILEIRAFDLPLHPIFDDELSSLGGKCAMLPGEFVVWTYAFPWFYLTRDGQRMTLQSRTGFLWVRREGNNKSIVRDTGGRECTVVDPPQNYCLFRLGKIGLTGAPRGVVINRLGEPTTIKRGASGEILEYVRTETRSRRQITHLMSSTSGTVGNQGVDLETVTEIPHDEIITYNPYAFAVFFNSEGRVVRIEDLCKEPAVWVRQN